MGTKQDIRTYLSELKKRLAKEMPKVREEIRLYEKRRTNGQLIKTPVPGPQFNA